jgi:hypothetical protein
MADAQKHKEREVIIRPAKYEDIKGILAVQKELLLGDRRGTDVQKRGFLVYSLNEIQLKNVISNNQNFLLVAEGKEGIVGYALASDLDEWRKNKPHWDEEVTAGTEIKKHLFKDRVLYFRHIARRDDFSGVGGKLEEEVYALAKNQGYQSVVGEVLERPVPNERSKQVHEKRGFRKIGEVDYRDGNVWGLYEKELKPRESSSLNVAFGIISIIGFLFSILSFSGITGNVIGATETNSIIGTISVLIGLTFGGIYLYLKKKC